MSAADAAIQKKTYGSGTTALIISNKDMEKKIVKSLKESRLLERVLVKQLKMKQKNKKENFFQSYWEQ